MSQQAVIVVVGAGLAGLSAATRLRELGFTHITVLEASDKVGGRVAKAHLGKACVDTGAQYIHGASEENPVYCLLKQSGLLSQVPEEGKSIFYRHSGHKANEVFVQCIYEAGEKIIWHRENDSKKSVGEHFAEKAHAFIENWKAEEPKNEVQSVLAMVGKDSLIDIGATDLHKVSLGSWKYYVDMGDDLNVEGLMFHVTEKLAEGFPKEKLLLNKTVTKIEWDGSFPGSGGQEHPVRVVCEGGEEILADHVIVTVSLGCLKACASTLFNPCLPAEKMEAINKLCFGNIAKIFLEYEKAFWESDVSRIGVIWDDDPVTSAASTVQSQWLKHLQLFTVMKPSERFGDVLVAWCPGDVADLVETMTEKDLSSAITEHIRKFTGDSSIPPPKTVLCTQWRNNSYTRGSYVFLPVGVDGQVMDVLAQPLVGTKNPSKDLQVLFAGEATIKTQYCTVQGAMMSGHREAKTLARHYDKTAPSTALCATHT